VKVNVKPEQLSIKHLVGALLISLFVGGALISCSILDKQNLPLHAPARHSTEAGSPVATLDGTTVRVMPYGASFEIPSQWLLDEEKNRNRVGYRESVYVSWEALDQLYKFNGDNALDAEIIDSVLPFEHCAAHVGSQGWGNYLTTDLYARLYVIDRGTTEFEADLQTKALVRGREVYNEANLKPAKFDKWNGRVMSIVEFGEHTILMKDLDFYYRAFGDKTVVFVFIHQYGWNKTIEEMLASFKWANESAGK
jgi:hypothetical protein